VEQATAQPQPCLNAEQFSYLLGVVRSDAADAAGSDDDVYGSGSDDGSDDDGSDDGCGLPTAEEYAKREWARLQREAAGSDGESDSGWEDDESGSDWEEEEEQVCVCPWVCGPACARCHVDDVWVCVFSRTRSPRHGAGGSKRSRSLRRS
jgi:hypothetical protein